MVDISLQMDRAKWVLNGTVSCSGKEPLPNTKDVNEWSRNVQSDKMFGLLSRRE